MDTRWADIAYKLGLEAAREGPERRRRWAGQNEWDAEHMHTESTRFTTAQDEQLRRCSVLRARYLLYGSVNRY